MAADDQPSEADMAQSVPSGPNGNTTAPAAASSSINTTASSTTALPPSLAARFRLPLRQLSRSELNAQSPLASPRLPPRRRSSLLSYSSLEDVRQSFTEDFISPRTSDARNSKDDDGLSHWHSTPLAFAILPALGGIFFNNGSAFITDILLLGLAAIFLNWSIRLPWDWYYSAQELRQQVEPSAEDVAEEEAAQKDTIVEEDEDEVAVETASSVGGSPRPYARRREREEPSEAQPQLSAAARAQAAASLQRQETLALIATFVFPVLAAYLLHVIRAQLSRPSTNLVSDYNLSIFLLAAEIRPCRQVIRLLSNRTLHLQRLATGVEEPFSSVAAAKSLQADLVARVAALESQLASHTLVPPTVSLAQKTDVADLSLDLRKRYEPRLEGLERAVRRYEKRSTTLAIAVETRLHTLETRLQEALSLTAAVAQQNQASGARVVATRVADGVTKLAIAPFKILAWVVSLPITLAESLYARFKTIMLGPVPSKPAGPRRKPGASDKNRMAMGANGMNGDHGVREKPLTRKFVR